MLRWRKGWMAGKVHPVSGPTASRLKNCRCRRGTVVLMWTHAAHGVTPRKEGQRYAVVRSVCVSQSGGGESRARWLSPSFEKKQIKGRRRIDEFVLERKSKMKNHRDSDVFWWAGFCWCGVYTDEGIVGNGEAGLWAHHGVVKEALGELMRFTYVGKDSAGALSITIRVGVGGRRTSWVRQ